MEAGAALIGCVILIAREAIQPCVQLKVSRELWIPADCSHLELCNAGLGQSWGKIYLTPECLRSGCAMASSLRRNPRPWLFSIKFFAAAFFSNF